MRTKEPQRYEANLNRTVVCIAREETADKRKKETLKPTYQTGGASASGVKEPDTDDRCRWRGRKRN